jgi:hypothetical protein
MGRKWEILLFSTLCVLTVCGVVSLLNYMDHTERMRDAELKHKREWLQTEWNEKQQQRAAERIAREAKTKATARAE